MPTINIDLTGAATVEAHVVMNVARLNDFLRIIIDQSNAHEAALDELRASLRDSNERRAALEKEVESMRPDAERLNRVVESLALMQDTVARDKADMESKLEATTKKLVRRLEACETALAEENAARVRWQEAVEQRMAAAAGSAKDAHARIDAIRVPDVVPLQKSIDDVVAARAADKTTLENCSMFVNLWGASHAGMQVATTDASKAPSPADATAIRTAYVRSLPPLAGVYNELDGRLTELYDTTAARLKDVHHELTGKVDKTQIADLLLEMKTHMKNLQEANEFMERRVKTVESLPRRVSDLEAGVDALRHSKVDLSMFSLKADEAAVLSLASELTDVKEDVEDLFGRLEKAGGGKAAPTTAAAVRRASSTSNLLASNALEDVKKRLAAVEAEAGRLERVKADREALYQLQDLIDALDRKLVGRRTSPTQRSPPPTGGVAALSPTAPTLPPGLEKRPPRQQSATTSRPGSSRRSPPKTNTVLLDSSSRPNSARDVRPIVTPVEKSDASLSGMPANNTWHIARGSNTVRDSSGHSTPALISGGSSTPVVVESHAF